jgi:hypothetical protein
MNVRECDIPRAYFQKQTPAAMKKECKVPGQANPGVAGMNHT